MHVWCNWISIDFWGEKENSHESESVRCACEDERKHWTIRLNAHIHMCRYNVHILAVKIWIHAWIHLCRLFPFFPKKKKTKKFQHQIDICFLISISHCASLLMWHKIAFEMLSVTFLCVFYSIDNHLDNSSTFWFLNIFFCWKFKVKSMRRASIWGMRRERTKLKKRCEVWKPILKFVCVRFFTQKSCSLLLFSGEKRKFSSVSLFNWLKGEKIANSCAALGIYSSHSHNKRIAIITLNRHF